MAEKNTRSILESIKNKLSKIDQKSDPNSAASDLASEFDYVATHDKVVAVQEPNNQAPSLNDKAEIVAQNSENHEEESLKNDIDSSAEFDKEDLEDYEHQIDFSSKPKDPTLEEDLDFNLPQNNDDLNLDDPIVNQKAAPKLDEELTFANEEEVPQAQENSASVPEIENFNLPEIEDEVDFLNEEVVAAKPLEQEPETLEPEEVEDEILSPLETNEDEILQPEEIAIEEELLTPENEDEIPTLETAEEEILEPEIEGISTPIAPQEEIPQPLTEESEIEQPLENEEEPAQIEAIEPIALEEEHEEIIDDLDHPHEEIIQNTKNVNAKDEDGYDSELERLEHELEEQEKIKHQHQEVPIIEESEVEDIELELEKDLMNFNPQNPDLNKFSATKNIEKNIAPIPAKTESQILSSQTIEKSREVINQLFQSPEKLSPADNIDDEKLKEITTEILHAKLDRWLNNNLPNLVEEIVRQEIKKIIPK